ncbi:hypothetical protein V1264_003570 [Littorina saxatilis]|uniref:EF-hand domain-containing protein n=2 Tax=Littorina saxatilis TaxID=31220 RepID=A0AAN9B7P8_9CAEN
MTAEGWHRISRTDYICPGKRSGTRTAQEVERLKEECLSLDMDPALGVTEKDVVTAFRKMDADGNGALLNDELGNFTSVLEIYEACETVNNIV